MKKARAIALVVSAVLSGVVLSMRPAAPIIRVAPGDTLQASIDAAPPGATVVLEAGTHQGPIEVSKTLVLRGEDGAEVVAPHGTDVALSVKAADVQIQDLTVRGGWTGIELHRASGAVVTDVAVRDAESEGVLVYAAPARLERVDVADMTSSHAQGIEVLSAPDTVVKDSTVKGGKVGIVGHLSHVVFEDNRVTGTAGVGVMIREMSRGVARGNVVTDATGAGLYCGDMSVCEFRDNQTSRISEVPGLGRSGAGWGLVIHYYATASSTDDELNARSGRIAVLSGSRLSETSPLERGSGWGAMIPAGIATSVALVGLGLLMGPIGLFTRKFLAPRASSMTADRRRAFVTALMIGLVAQSFHMLEHLVQVFRVYWDGVPSRGSLVGSVVDTEWVHFTYNALVLLAIATVLWWRRSGWVPRRTGLGDRFMATALFVQAYHVVEHSLKVFQHVSTGAKVNPGILGGEVNLVWLHFGINLAVYVAFALGCAVYLWRLPSEDIPFDTRISMEVSIPSS